MKYINVKEVKAASMQHANVLLEAGWVLLDMFADSDGFITYVLGRVE